MPRFPSSFPPKRESITTFDFTDIASGTGTEIYQALTTDETAGTQFLLVDNVTDKISTNAETEVIGDVAQDALELQMDQDFDLPQFNLTRTIKGTGFIRVSTKTELSQASNLGDVDMWFVFKIVHFDGATETVIGTATQSKNNFTSLTSNVRSNKLMKIDFTERIFKKGDILRLTVEGWVDANNGAAAGSTGVHHTVGHSPTETSGSDLGTNTKLILWIPYKIET